MAGVRQWRTLEHPAVHHRPVRVHVPGSDEEVGGFRSKPERSH
jgi:hypothetical protein